MYLSQKSDALQLFQFIQNDVVRDEIMYWVSPMDVVHFVIGTGVVFDEEDMDKYTSVFKYVIPNRAWLLSMMGKGYTFTIVGRRLNEMVNTSMREKWIPDALYDFQTDEKKTVCVILFVTKDESFVACDDTAVPEKLFQITKDDEITEVTRNNITPRTRIINTSKYGVPIRIMCSIEESSINFPMFLNPDVYEVALIEGYEDLGVSKYSVMYSHMTNGRSKINGPVPNTYDKKYEFADAARSLFSIRTNSQSAWDRDKGAVFRIDKHEFELGHQPWT